MKAMWNLLLIVALAAPAWAQQPSTAPSDKEGVALTVYNGGFGVIREVRMLDVPAKGEIKFTDVAKRIDPTTVHFSSLANPTGVKLLEQNYQYDLVSADKLLAKYIDQPIEVFAKDKKYAGTLLSFDEAQLVLKEEAGLAMVQRPLNVQDIRFKSLPEGLLTKPTLVWTVAADKPGKQLCETTYQTLGMKWHAEYVLVLRDDDKQADLSGWISVDNSSGKTYKDAVLKFVAGDVRREIDEPEEPREMFASQAMYNAAPTVTEKEFFEYHMYTLLRKSTVADNEVKQLEMFTPVQGIKVEKKYLYQPSQAWHYYGQPQIDQSFGLAGDKKVAVFIEFVNDEANKLGMPLPAGKIRVNKQDPDDKALEFIGEEKIDHTPRKEKLSLQIGNAFDLVGERVQKDFKVTGEKSLSETLEFKLRNNKKKDDVVIRIKEVLFRAANWKISEKSRDFTKLDAHTIVFDVPVPADKEVTVTFTVDYTW